VMAPCGDALFIYPPYSKIPPSVENKSKHFGDATSQRGEMLSHDGILELRLMKGCTVGALRVLSSDGSPSNLSSSFYKRNE